MYFLVEFRNCLARAVTTALVDHVQARWARAPGPHALGPWTTRRDARAAAELPRWAEALAGRSPATRRVGTAVAWTTRRGRSSTSCPRSARCADSQPRDSAPRPHPGASQLPRTAMITFSFSLRAPDWRVKRSVAYFRHYENCGKVRSFPRRRRAFAGRPFIRRRIHLCLS